MYRIQKVLKARMGQCHKEILYALIIMLTSFNFGFIISYPSPVLPYYTSKWNIQPLHATAFNAISSLTACFGTYLNTFLFKFVGRKIVAFIISIFTMISWGLLFLISEKRFWVGIVARGLLGISLGASSSLAPLYLSEIAPPEQKGFYGSFNAEGIIMSIMTMFEFSDYFEPWVLNIVGMAPCFLQACLIWFVPETNSPQMFKEEGQNTIRESFCQMKNIKVFAIALSAIVVQQLTAPNAILTNLNSLIVEAKVPIKPGMAGSIIMGGQLISIFASSALVDKLGRRLMWLLSGIFTCVTLAVYGVNIKFKWSPFIALVMIFLYQLAFGIAIGPMPWYLAPQMVPSAFSSLAASLNSTINWFLSFGTIFVYEPLNKAMGEFGSFILFASVALLGGIYGFFAFKESGTKENSDEADYQPQVDTDALEGYL